MGQSSAGQSSEVPTSLPVDDWLAELGDSTGAPGGGAASGILLGVAASLFRMVAAYTPDDPRAAESAGRLVELRADALRAAETDGAVSADFGAALGLAPDHPDRGVRVREAALGAAHSAGRIGRVGIELIREMRLLREIGNPHLTADLAVGAAALASGIAGASVTLRANLRTARAHHAPPAALSEIVAEASQLSEAQREVEQFSAELSSEFDA